MHGLAVVLTLRLFCSFPAIPVLRTCFFLLSLGTAIHFLIAFSLLSVQRGGRVEIIANDQGHRITPSWVSFTDDERLYVLFFYHSPPCLTLKLESVTRLKMRSTQILPTQSSTLSVSSAVRWMNQRRNATSSIGLLFLLISPSARS